MRRLNFTLDESTITLLDGLARALYEGNKSQTIRAALQSLSTRSSRGGWIIAGYAPAELRADAPCHTCGAHHRTGDVLFRAVFEPGDGPQALETLPVEDWLDCTECVSRNVSDGRNL